MQIQPHSSRLHPRFSATLFMQVNGQTEYNNCLRVAQQLIAQCQAKPLETFNPASGLGVFPVYIPTGTSAEKQRFRKCLASVTLPQASYLTQSDLYPHNRHYPVVKQKVLELFRQTPLFFQSPEA